MLEYMQQLDPDVEQIVVYCRFVVAYWLHPDQPQPGWRKANIEGPAYLVQRRTDPRYHFLVKNQFSTDNFADDVHPDWELDCQTNYIFYKVERTNPNQRIRGLWFSDDSERGLFEHALRRIIAELHASGRPPTSALEQLPPDPSTTEVPQACLALGDTASAEDVAGESATVDTHSTVEVTSACFMDACHSLAEDPAILAVIMDKIRAAAATQQED